LQEPHIIAGAGDMGHSDRAPSPPQAKHQKTGDASSSDVSALVPMDTGTLNFPPKASVDLESRKFQDLMEDSWKKNFETYSHDLFQSLQAPVSGLVKNVCSDAMSGMQQKVENVEAKVDAVATAQKSQQALLENISKELKDLKLAHGQNAPSSDMSQGPVNGSPSPGPCVTDSGFFRSPDPTLLFCNVAGGAKVAREKFHDSVVKLAAEANLEPTSFDLVGDTLDDRFEIKWKGDFRYASSKCHQFFSSLQLGRGRWKKQVVLDSQNQEIQFFVGPDKNASQIKREVLSKALRSIVQSEIQGKEVWVKKSTGTLFVDRRRLLTIHVTGESSARIDWSHPKRIDLRLEQGPIEEQFRSLVSEGGGQHS